MLQDEYMMSQMKNNGKPYPHFHKSGQVLRDGGKILILGNRTNEWSKYENAEKWLSQLNSERLLDYNLTLTPLVEIDENHIYRTNHVFRKMTVDDETIVNEMYTIVKTN